MAKVQSILSLHAQGWAQRRIARELGIARETVRKYIEQQICGSKPANAPTGWAESKPATLAGLPAPGPKPAAECHESPGPIGAPADPASPKPAAVFSEGPGPTGPPSQCKPYHDQIMAKVATGLSARRIHQDLTDEGAAVHYDSVRRYVRRLGRVRALPFRRLECAAGEEAQVDFGSGAPVVSSDGKRRKTHVFRIVLSHSRKAYSEATFTQTTNDFLGALENAFRHFGGVPRTLVIDNLKAAVAHPDWFDPELTPKVQSFCQHYGTVILPTRPYMPRHKGKVEAGVKYVKNNALKGRTFTSLEAEQRHLAHWELAVADTRIHGTTKQQVGKLFETERTALLALPLDPFANFQEAQRKVNRDGHVEVAKAYYSAPPEYLGRTVWVRWDARLVRIFNHRWEQVALHVRREPGRFSTLGEHLAPEKISGLERGAAYLLEKVRWIGPQTHAWAQAMLTARGIEGTRVLQGLLSLTKRHSYEALEKACEIALSHGAYRLRTLRRLLDRNAAPQTPLPFLEEHPIIRPLDDYAQVVARAIHRQTDRSSMSEGFTRHGSGVRDAVENEHSPSDPSRQSCDARSTRPRPGYPSAGCSSAEPASVSPDSSSVVPPPSFHQESHHE
ncbi:MAG TPA: IS21 family transposase [Pirellulales bacterium]|jgi:transposase|nr:IS21 family transposase [Pirellulales bacterium]